MSRSAVSTRNHDPRDDFRARKEAQEAIVKDQLIAKLKENGVLSDDQMDLFKVAVVKYEGERCVHAPQWQQSSRPPQRLVDERFGKVSLHFFTGGVINYLKHHVPNDRCIQTYEDVMSVVPISQDRKASSRVNPREKPFTQFSVSRAAPGSVKSNAELIDALALATNMETKTAIGIRGQITFCDSISDGNSGMLNFGEGSVMGGRLGRDHMLRDVPNNYVRDRLMDYTITEVEEDKRDQARRAVFSDLSPAEIEEYTALIMQKIEKNKPKTREQMIARVTGGKPTHTNAEAMQVLNLAWVVDDIDEEIDLTPMPGFARYRPTRPISNSVVIPDLKGLTPEERDIDVGTDIDRDYEQIRAMIAQLTNGTEWTVDQFRLALGSISRQQLTKFIGRIGPKEGQNSRVFPLAWEFFKKREILGLPLTGTSNDSNVLRERDGNANKHPSDDAGKDEGSRKRTRRA